jgi:hypothetical protein
MYFRIKRVEADGHISYSAVKLINLEFSGSLGIQTYPNPVTSNIRIQFEENQNGHFLLELINISGQVIQQKSVNLSSANRVDFDLAVLYQGIVCFTRKDLSITNNILPKYKCNNREKT